MRILAMVLHIIEVLLLAFICVAGYFAYEKISSDHDLLNVALMNQSQAAARCSYSALDQVENYIADQEGKGSKIRAEKMVKRIREHERIIGKGTLRK